MNTNFSQEFHVKVSVLLIFWQIFDVSLHKLSSSYFTLYTLYIYAVNFLELIKDVLLFRVLIPVAARSEFNFFNHQLFKQSLLSTKSCSLTTLFHWAQAYGFKRTRRAFACCCVISLYPDGHQNISLKCQRSYFWQIILVLCESS